MFHGKLLVDFFATDQFLIPNSELRKRQTQVANPKISVQIRRASVFARYFMVSESASTSIQEGLMKWPARYNYNEVKSNTFVS